MPTFKQVAQEYADLNVFNEDTRETIIRIADLFDRRSGSTTETYSLQSVIGFKKQTLAVAKTVTYNGYLRYLRVLGDYAVERGHINENFFREIKTAPEGQKIQKTISDNDIWIMLSHVRDYQEKYEPLWFWLAVINVLFYTGMRRRQLVSLRTRHLDFSEGSECIFLSTEGSKTRREWSIPMHPSMVQQLKDVLKHNECVLGRQLKPNDPVFNLCWYISAQAPCPKNPEQMKATSITDFFRRVNKRTGLKISPHKFRHSLATKLCNPEEGSPDIFGTQALLGHTSIKTTRDYVQTSQGRLCGLMSSVDMPTLAQNVLRKL